MKKNQRQVEVLEEKIQTLERKLEELSLPTYTTIQNVYKILLDPQSSQDRNWKSYWQKQIKSLVEL